MTNKQIIHTHLMMCMKLFKSSNIDLVKQCQSYFCCVNMPSLTVKDRSQKFITKHDNSDNTFCHFCSLL